ncbi:MULTISPECIES: hypothetical protein [unclassified Lysobacter]
MSFNKLITKVAQAENALEANERRVGADLRQLRDSWKSAWTPGRIVIAGLAGGFLVGRGEPFRSAARNGGVVRIVSLLTGLFASTTASAASQTAEEAEQTAQRAVGVAAGTTPGPDPAAAASERLAHDFLERAAAAARQAGGATGP